ncbi:hypothetical protein BB561_004974 [Smittium simulii]|uniref:Uncharacterized protein n=1 Tax=Smittium simulii TaxID=133385 RepID=A0A2T9YCW7_9FUNG|nr:hypothetical protein BB561_004974 [Smittium simulii]
MLTSSHSRSQNKTSAISEHIIPNDHNPLLKPPNSNTTLANTNLCTQAPFVVKSLNHPNTPSDSLPAHPNIPRSTLAVHPNIPRSTLAAHPNIPRSTLATHTNAPSNSLAAHPNTPPFLPPAIRSTHLYHFNHRPHNPVTHTSQSCTLDSYLKTKSATVQSFQDTSTFHPKNFFYFITIFSFFCLISLAIILAIYFTVLHKLVYHAIDYVDLYMNSYKIKQYPLAMLLPNPVSLTTNSLKNTSSTANSIFISNKTENSSSFPDNFQSTQDFINSHFNSSESQPTFFLSSNNTHFAINNTVDYTLQSYNASFWGFYINHSPFTIKLEFITPLQIYWNNSLLGFATNPQILYFSKKSAVWSLLGISINNFFQPSLSTLPNTRLFTSKRSLLDTSLHLSKNIFNKLCRNYNFFLSQNLSNNLYFPFDPKIKSLLIPKNSSPIKSLFQPAYKRNFENNSDNTTAKLQSFPFSEQQSENTHSLVPVTFVNTTHLNSFYQNAKENSLVEILWYSTVKVTALGISTIRPFFKNIKIACSDKTSCLVFL